MLRLHNNEVIYNNSEKLGAVEDMSFINDGFSIALPDGSIVFIPERDSTAKEKAVFQAYHGFYKDTDGIKPQTGITLEQAKVLKLNELDMACNTEILAGFYSSVKGKKKLYGLSYEDQLNMESLKNNVSLGFIKDGELEYYAKGQACEIWSNSDFIKLYNEAMTFKTGRIKLCKELKEQVGQASEIGCLKQIRWTLAAW